MRGRWLSRFKEGGKEKKKKEEKIEKSSGPRNFRFGWCYALYICSLVKATEV